MHEAEEQPEKKIVAEGRVVTDQKIVTDGRVVTDQKIELQGADISWSARPRNVKRFVSKVDSEPTKEVLGPTPKRFGVVMAPTRVLTRSTSSSREIKPSDEPDQVLAKSMQVIMSEDKKPTISEDKVTTSVDKKSRKRSKKITKSKKEKVEEKGKKGQAEEQTPTSPPPPPPGQLAFGTPIVAHIPVPSPAPPIDLSTYQEESSPQAPCFFQQSMSYVEEEDFDESSEDDDISASPSSQARRQMDNDLRTPVLADDIFMSLVSSNDEYSVHDEDIQNWQSTGWGDF